MVLNMRELLLFIKSRLNFAVAGVLLFILLSPQELWDKRFDIFRFDHLMFAVITFIFILTFAANWLEKKQFFTKWVRENIWIALFTAALMISVAVSTNPMLSLELLPRVLSGLFMVYIICSGEFTYEKIRSIFGVVACGLIVASVYAVIQAIQGIAPNPSFTDLAVNPNTPGRVYSFFGNPNVFGFALAALLPVLAAYTLRGKSRIFSTLGTVSFILGLAALIMTYSRGAWFGFAAGMFVFVVLCKPKLVPIFLVLGLIALPFIPSSIKERVLSSFNPNDTSMSDRGDLFDAGIKLIQTHPIFGAGLGIDTVKAFVLDNNFWPTRHLARGYTFAHTHNLFLQAWCEMGILGFVTFFGIIVHNIIRAFRNFRKQSMSVKLFISALISGIIAILVCGIADYTLSYSRIMLLFWILLGLLVSATKAGVENSEINGQ